MAMKATTITKRASELLQDGDITGRLDELRRPAVELARRYTVEAVEKIIAIMNKEDAPASAQLAAACEILDRGHGKAPATVEGNVKHDHEHHHVHEPLSETARWIEGILRDTEKGDGHGHGPGNTNH